MEAKYAKSVFKIISSYTQAFTLVELMVSIGIMAIVLGISISGAPSAIMRLALSDNTYQTELLIREAQLQGSAINSVNDTYGGTGVYFNLATSSLSIKFRDKVVIANPPKAIAVGNGLYDQAAPDEKNSTLALTNRNRIAKLCVASGAGPLTCYDNSVTPLKTLTVSFSRPKQTAHIYLDDSTSTDYTTACIELDSLRAPEKGYVRSILVYKSGMITKKIATCL